MLNRKYFAVAGLAACLFGLAWPAHAVEFPPAGQDIIQGVVTFEIQMAGEFVGEPEPVDFIGRFEGPTIVQRGDPYPDDSAGGQNAIDTEIVSLELLGQVQVVGTTDAWPAHLTLQASRPSFGRAIDTNVDPGIDFPAESFFDIFFEIQISGTPLGDVMLLNDEPLRMSSLIDQIPPDLGLTPYESDPAAPVTLLLPAGQPVGVVFFAKHTPEPGTIVLLVFGGLTLAGWKLIRRRRAA